MKIRFFALVAICSFLLTACTETQQKETVNNLTTYPKSIGDEIFTYASPFPNQTQLAIAVVKDGTTQYYGIEKQDNIIKEAKNEQKIFEIGSITKVFTSTVLADFVTQGKVKLDDFINPQYSFPFKNNTKIKYQDLANHTSGLPRLPDNLPDNNTDPYRDYDKTKLETYLKDRLKLETQAGSVSAYSNLGVGLLGFTLGKVEKMEFSELLQKHIFDTYNMKHSYTNIKDIVSTNEEVIKGLTPKGNQASNWTIDALLGAGGVLSTTEDMIQFAKAQFDTTNTAITLAHKKTFTISNNLDIALGWHLIKRSNKRDLLWHNGGTGGYTSFLAVDPAEKFAVVILSNVSALGDLSKNINNLGFRLVRQLNP